MLYPALREWGDKADADKLNHDHGYVKQYLYTLESMAKDAPDFLMQLAEFLAVRCQARLSQGEDDDTPNGEARS